MTQDSTENDSGTHEHETQRESGWPFYKFLAGYTLLSCIAVLVCDVTMWFLVQDYNPIRQTISDLAAGPHHWLQDMGIVLFAAGILSVTGALIIRGENGWKPFLLKAMLVLLALDIVLIALWNEYGDGDAGGPVIHIYLVAILYALVAGILWFGVTASPYHGERMAKITKILSVMWVISAPFFFIVPSSIDGGYERLLALFLVGAVATIGWELFVDSRKSNS